MRWAASSLLLGAAASLLSPAAGLAVRSSGPKCAADYFVKSLPGQPPGPLIKMHAGHIEVDPDSNGNLFFWHFQNKHIANRPRTVIWLNGGPGCSSMDGALMEVGPYRLKDDHTLIDNDGSWHEFANLLFVDQPVGTGFSYVNSDSYLTELNQMSDQFMIFLTKFFEIFPEYETEDIYITGESYAGQHIPYIADAILRRNADAATKQKWNVKGLLIGNGWIDPATQYLSYLTFAYENGLVERGSPIADSIERQVAICVKTIAEKGRHHVDLEQCEQILQDILQKTKRSKGGKDMCWNMYDVRLEDTYPSCGMNWPPDLAYLTPYLRRPEVTEALHVDHAKKSGWTECAGAVSSSFRAAHSKPSVELLPGLLEHMPVLLFSGNKDLICNHIGTEELIHNLEWNGGKGFELAPGTWAPREDWVFEGELAGIYQSARNLTYVLIYNSSHMVPFDYPRRTRYMLDRFMEVDIGRIGGPPTDSTIGGERTPITSVGGTPNSTTAVQEEKERLDRARWAAYYRSGEIALVLVATAAAIWGIFVCRQRRSRKKSKGSYAGLGMKRTGGSRDRLADERESFDEDELREITVTSPIFERERDLESAGVRRYSLGGASSDESGDEVEPIKRRNRK